MHNVHLHYICVLGITNMHSLQAMAYVRRYTIHVKLSSFHTGSMSSGLKVSRYARVEASMHTW